MTEKNKTDDSAINEDAYPVLVAAARAAIAYDQALEACANDPRKMSSFCTVEGEHLDVLYERWRNLSMSAISIVGE